MGPQKPSKDVEVDCEEDEKTAPANDVKLSAEQQPRPASIQKVPSSIIASKKDTKALR